MKQVLLPAMLACGVLLAGCQSNTVREQARAGFEAGKTETESHAGRLRDEIKRPEPEVLVAESDTAWLGTGEVVEESALPDFFQKSVVWRMQRAMPLSTIAQEVSSQLGIPIRVQPEANSFSTGNQQQGGAISDPRDTLRINYTGPLEGFLNLLASRTSNYWKWDGREVSIYRRETRTWVVSMLAGRMSTQTTIRNAGSAAGGQSATDSVVVQTDFDPFREITDTIGQMLTRGGQGAQAPGSVRVDAATGLVTVTDSPAVIAQVDDFIQRLNRRMSRQVLLDVTVFSLTVEDEGAYGVDWALAWRSINGRYRSLIRTGSLTSVDSQSGTLAVGVTDPSWNYDGTAAFLQALSKYGRVSLVTRQTPRTLTGQLVPIQAVSEFSYIDKIQTDLVANVGSTTQAELSTRSVGLTMNLLPVVLEDDDILLNLSFQQSALRRLDVRDVLGSRLESPQVDSKATHQRIRLKSGEGAVITAFNQSRSDSQTRSVAPNENAWALGGGADDKRSQEMLVILVKARVD